jgi:hypothetical protein
MKTTARVVLFGGVLVLLASCRNGYTDNYCTWGTWDWYQECDLIEGRGCRPIPECRPCCPCGPSYAPGTVVRSRWVGDGCAPVPPEALAPTSPPPPVVTRALQPE